MNRFFSTPKWHTNYVKKINIKIDNFPLQNYKIVQLSDLHLGDKKLNKTNLQDIVKKTLSLKPDIVLITGDLIDGKSKFRKETISPLKELTKVVECYFVLGNHELGCYKNDIMKFIKHLKDIGIKPLINQSAKVEHKGRAFNLVGLSDYTGVFYDFPPSIKESFKDVDTSLETIVMVHRAGWIKRLKNEKFSLVLSGHNHGGQIAPFGLWIVKVRCKSKYINGLYKIDKDKWAFVSSGLGYSRLPFRFMAKSEIGLIVLN